MIVHTVTATPVRRLIPNRTDVALRALGLSGLSSMAVGSSHPARVPAMYRLVGPRHADAGR
ncbi:MAG: hypothetical protein AAF914_12965 [Pseudomonadota bacterium]